MCYVLYLWVPYLHLAIKFGAQALISRALFLQHVYCYCASRKTTGCFAFRIATHGLRCPYSAVHDIYKILRAGRRLRVKGWYRSKRENGGVFWAIISDII